MAIEGEPCGRGPNLEGMLAASAGVPAPAGRAVAQEVFDVLAVLNFVGMALGGESLGDF